MSDPTGKFTLLEATTALGANQSLLLIALPKILFGGWRILGTYELGKRLLSPAAERISETVCYIGETKVADLYITELNIYAIGFRILGSMQRAFSFGEELTGLASDGADLVNEIDLENVLKTSSGLLEFITSTREFFDDIK